MNVVYAIALLFISFQLSAQSSGVFGKVSDPAGNSLADIKIIVLETGETEITAENGSYKIDLQPGDYTLKFENGEIYQEIIPLSVAAGESRRMDFVMNGVVLLDGTELFGAVSRQPEKLDQITRLPLKPSESIQTITTISEKVIEKQGILTISDAARNAPGVYTYATYGNVRESLGLRGFRGVPTLKNGVRVHSDFRGTGFITDMQGVESVQVIKGASAVTQGFGLDLGSAGGVVNLVTKTPKFENFRSMGLRAGSWNQIRPVFDFNQVLNTGQTLAFRLNGAYEHNDGVNGHLNLNKHYINPSFKWLATDDLEFTLEMDYLHDNRRPDPGTVNFSRDNSENEIYDIPKDMYLGFDENFSKTKNLTYSFTSKYKFSPKLYVRAGFYGSDLDLEGNSTSLRQSANAEGIIENPNMVRRSISPSNWRKDNNQVAQIDLVMHEMNTGEFKHLLQIGGDYRTTDAETKSFNAVSIDEIDIFSSDISNNLPIEPEFNETGNSSETTTQLGALAQYVVEYKKWARAFAGIRYSNYDSESVNGRLNNQSQQIEFSSSESSGNTWNPVFGLMVYPVKDLALFSSYTSTTNPRNASDLDQDGNQLGNETSNQFEFGFKSNLFRNRLRFNSTFFIINNNNMIMQDVALNDEGVLEFLPWNIKGGDDKRKGIEVEAIGRITENWEIMAGYSWLNAEYQNSTRFVDGSRPNNTPEHVANFWTNYTVDTGKLKGFSAGAGVYYMGERPYNDHVFTEFHGITPGLAPWNNKAFTTVNAQLGYARDRYGIQLFINNIFDEIGYNAYRSNFINRIDPRNFAVQLNYRF